MTRCQILAFFPKNAPDSSGDFSYITDISNKRKIFQKPIVRKSQNSSMRDFGQANTVPLPTALRQWENLAVATPLPPFPPEYGQHSTC